MLSWLIFLRCLQYDFCNTISIFRSADVSFYFIIKSNQDSTIQIKTLQLWYWMQKHYTLSKEIYRYTICDVTLLRLLSLQNNIKTLMHSPMSILFPIPIYISHSYVGVLFSLSMIFVCNISNKTHRYQFQMVFSYAWSTH